jgi:extracellular factor (EF) 3-hydroxypalmitic acid methyl ester biosynthesis protein
MKTAVANKTLLQVIAGDLLKQFQELGASSSPEQLRQFMTVFSAYIAQLENQFSRESIVAELHQLRQAMAGSPFMARAQQWPRGYPGDFQTIEYILEGINHAEPGTIGFLVEDHFLQSPICEQHRNKVEIQAAYIEKTLLNNHSSHILSIGCGTSADLYLNKHLLEKFPCTITLLDIDEEALQYSTLKLGNGVFKLNLVQGNIYRHIHSLQQPVDLVVIGGVFDYLSDRVIQAILAKLAGLLKPGGKILFSNIANNNPYRICMGYLADWVLIERSEEDLVRLVQDSGAVFSSIEINREMTGLTFVVTLER